MSELSATISADARAQYEKFFASLGPTDGHISGSAAWGFLRQSQLRDEQLRRICELADRDKDTMFTAPEFFVAMHLAHFVRRGGTVPGQVPQSLFESKTADAFDSLAPDLRGASAPHELHAKEGSVAKVKGEPIVQLMQKERREGERSVEEPPPTEVDKSAVVNKSVPDAEIGTDKSRDELLSGRGDLDGSVESRDHTSTSLAKESIFSGDSSKYDGLSELLESETAASPSKGKGAGESGGTEEGTQALGERKDSAQQEGIPAAASTSEPVSTINGPVASSFVGAQRDSSGTATASSSVPVDSANVGHRLGLHEPSGPGSAARAAAPARVTVPLQQQWAFRPSGPLSPSGMPMLVPQMTGSSFAVGLIPSGASQTEWTVPAAAREKFSKTFARADFRNEGSIDARRAYEVFARSKLPNETIQRICLLADADQDSRMNVHEYVVAMFLIHRAMKGRPLPPSLPPSLLASAMGGSASDSRSSPAPPAHGSSRDRFSVLGAVQREEERKDALRSELVAAQSARDLAAENLKKAEALTSSVGEAVAELKEKVAAERAAVAELQGKIQFLGEDYSRLTQQRQVLEQQLEQGQKVVAAATMEAAEQQRLTEQSSKENEELLRLLAELRAKTEEISTVVVTNSEIQKENEKAREALEHQLHELKMAYGRGSVRVLQQKRTLATQKEQIEELGRRRDAAAMQRQEQLAALENQRQLVAAGEETLARLSVVEETWDSKDIRPTSAASSAAEPVGVRGSGLEGSGIIEMTAASSGGVESSEIALVLEEKERDGSGVAPAASNVVEKSVAREAGEDELAAPRERVTASKKPYDSTGTGWSAFAFDEEVERSRKPTDLHDIDVAEPREGKVLDESFDFGSGGREDLSSFGFTPVADQAIRAFDFEELPGRREGEADRPAFDPFEQDFQGTAKQGDADGFGFQSGFNFGFDTVPGPGKSDIPDHSPVTLVDGVPDPLKMDVTEHEVDSRTPVNTTDEPTTVRVSPSRQIEVDPAAADRVASGTQHDSVDTPPSIMAPVLPPDDIEDAKVTDSPRGHRRSRRDRADRDRDRDGDRDGDKDRDRERDRRRGHHGHRKDDLAETEEERRRRKRREREKYERRKAERSASSGAMGRPESLNVEGHVLDEEMSKPSGLKSPVDETMMAHMASEGGQSSAFAAELGKEPQFDGFPDL